MSEKTRAHVVDDLEKDHQIYLAARDAVRSISRNRSRQDEGDPSGYHHRLHAKWIVDRLGLDSGLAIAIAAVIRGIAYGTFSSPPRQNRQVRTEIDPMDDRRCGGGISIAWGEYNL